MWSSLFGRAVSSYSLSASPRTSSHTITGSSGKPGWFEWLQVTNYGSGHEWTLTKCIDVDVRHMISTPALRASRISRVIDLGALSVDVPPC